MSHGADCSRCGGLNTSRDDIICYQCLDASAMELKAAIKLDDLMHATAARPNRHHDIIRMLRDHGWIGSVQGARQGFDHKGAFISRAEAAKLVGKEGILFTEDLW